MDQKKQQQINEQAIESVDIGKAYLVFDRRNQWTDWNGNTAVTRRPWGLVPSIRDAEDWAESSRLQGTSFLIDELPAICVRCQSGVLLLTERGASRPMDWYSSIAASLNGVHSIGTLATAISSSSSARRVIQHTFYGHISVTPADGNYYSRQSSPGKGANHLAWSLKSQNVDDKPMREIVADLQRLILHPG